MYSEIRISWAINYSNFHSNIYKPLFTRIIICMNWFELIYKILNLTNLTEFLNRIFIGYKMHATYITWDLYRCYQLFILNRLLSINNHLLNFSPRKFANIDFFLWRLYNLLKVYVCLYTLSMYIVNIKCAKSVLL